MKKTLAILFASLISASVFALNFGDIKGTWQDSKWNANWTFTGDGKIILSDSVTGNEIFTFTDGNVQNFKFDAKASGVSISFSCKETERSYKFTKELSLNTDLTMHINPEWTESDYDVKIKFKK